MKRSGIYLLILLYLLVLKLNADDASGYAFPMLRYGIGVRAQGMGKAYSAISNDPIGVYWNAAGTAMPQFQTWQFEVGYDQLFFEDMSIGYFSGFYPSRKLGTFGIVLISFNQGEFIGTDQFGQSTGDFKNSESLLGVSYAKYLGDVYYIKRLRAGLLFKSLRRSINSTNTSVADFDFSLKFKVPKLKQLDLAFVYGNLMGAKIGEDELVSNMTFGLSYLFMKKILVATDFYMPSEGAQDVRVGLEYQFLVPKMNAPLSLRGGYSKNEIALGASLGIGLPANMLTRVDYVFTNQSEIEYSSSKFSLALFGANEPCHVRLKNILGFFDNPTRPMTANYKEFNQDRLTATRITDLGVIANDCQNEIFGPLANILVGNARFYQGRYEEAKAEYRIGYRGLYSQSNFESILDGDTTDSTAKNVALVVRYETHCNFAEAFLHTEDYEQGYTFLEPVLKSETFIHENIEATPKTNYKYRFKLDMGNLLFANRQYAEAINVYRDIIFAQSDQRTEECYNIACFMQAKSYIETENYDEAGQMLNRIQDISIRNPGILIDYPDISPTHFADNFIQDDKIYLSAIIAQKQNNMELAKELMNKIIYQYPYSDCYQNAIDFFKKN